MATIIGKLAVVVSANTAGIVSGLGKATSALKSFATTAASVATGMVAANALTGGVKGLVDFAANTFSSVDAVGDLAEKLGVGVEALSALQHAATMTDVDVESLNTGLGMFVKTMGKAGKSTDDLLGSFADVADQVANTNGIVEQGKIALDNFGKGGLSLLPLLRKGRSGIEELAKEAKDLGVAFNAVDVEKIGEADNALKRMKASIKGVGASIASAFAPIIQTLAKFATNLMKAIRPFIEAVADQLQPAIDRFSNSFKDFNASDLLKSITPALTVAGEVIDSVLSSMHGSFGRFLPPMLEGFASMVDSIDLMAESFKKAENRFERLQLTMMKWNPASSGMTRAYATKRLQLLDEQAGGGRTQPGDVIRNQAKQLALDSLWASMGTPVGDAIKKMLDGVQARISGWRPGEIMGPYAAATPKLEPKRDATLVAPFMVQAAMGWARAAEIAFGPKKPSSELGDALVKGSKEALSFVNRFRAGGDDIQKKQLDGDIRREKALDRIDKNIEDVKNNLDDEADI